MEPFYPLHAYVCSECFLVQLEEYVTPEDIFTEYAYFSSYSDTWVEHARLYTESMIDRFGLNADSEVIEVASNDGYLLQHFARRNIPNLGIEPAKNIAQAAIERGIPTRCEFFGLRMAKKLLSESLQPDLLLGNNVLAQVTDLNDFVAGMKLLLKPRGIITLEFPHLMRLVEGNQFDTIYHEHFSYFSFLTVERIFASHGLTVFDVEELDTHGGSLRIFGRHSVNSEHEVTADVENLHQQEIEKGYMNLETYRRFEEQVRATKRALLDFLIAAKREGKSIVGYGAPGKGNTLLNYCGIRQDYLDYTVDRNPYKQGKYTPGTHIYIDSPSRISETKPDYILILPWNLKEEVMHQMSYVQQWGGKFVVPIPAVQVFG